jgi:hypothetical protein
VVPFIFLWFGWTTKSPLRSGWREGGAVSCIFVEQKKILIYEILQQYKRKQQRLIASGIIERPKITDDIFTPEQEREFNEGHSVEEVFDHIAKKYGF